MWMTDKQEEGLTSAKGQRCGGALCVQRNAKFEVGCDVGFLGTWGAEKDEAGEMGSMHLNILPSSTSS
jgi:hypothetical protein